MAGDESRIPPDGKARLALQHAQRGNRDRHQGRLGVFGELQGFARAVPDGGSQLLAERRIDLVEHRPRGRKGLRQALAHTDRLGTLPRKSKCSRHRRSLYENWGRKTLTEAGMSSRGAE
jgi:hypothetical protein